MDRRALGSEAEATARDYLTRQGLRIVCANFLCKMGELDLVAIHGDVLAIVEVRLRTRGDFGNAADSIDQRKQRRIIRAARFLLMTHRELRRYPLRFDVVTLDRAKVGAEPRIEWIRAAFIARG